VVIQHFLTHDEGERMNSLLNIRVPLVATCFCLLCTGALTSTRAADEKPKVATTHYVDNAKHFAIDVPLTWERKFPENEDERIRFIFATGGKAAANAQPPEFLVVTTGPEAKDELKSLAAFAAAVRKQITADDKNAKFDKDKEMKLDGEPALAFSGTKATKAGPAKVVYLVAIRDGIGYSVSFACDPATFDGEHAGAKAVVDSWKWSK